MRSSTIDAARASKAEPVNRTKPFGTVMAGVAIGLPIPERTDVYAFHMLVLTFDDGDTDAVNRWASFLGMPEAVRGEHVYDVDSGKPWVTYMSREQKCPRLPGWSAHITCHVPATAEQVAAARAEVTK